MQALKLLGQQLNKIWHQLGINQKLMIVASGVIVLLGLGALVYWSTRPDNDLLFGKLDQAEAATVEQALDEMKIPWVSGSSGSSIYIARAQVARVRGELILKGVPKPSVAGYEILDRPTFGLSDDGWQANYARAREGELDKTISTMAGIESSRTRIQSPKQTLIERPDDKVTASVYLILRGSLPVPAEEVAAIRSLVANAVPRLKASNVSITDNQGHLLSDVEDEGSVAALSNKVLANRKSWDSYLEKKVTTALEKEFGPDEVIVTIAAIVDNDTFTKKDEFYPGVPSNDGKLKGVVRSETVNSEHSLSATPLPGGVGGVTTNSSVEPNTAASKLTQNASDTINNQTDYAVSASVTNITRLPGSIKRMTASVMINTNNNPTPFNAETIRTQVIAMIGMEVGESTAEGPAPELAGVSVVGTTFNKSHDVAQAEQISQEQRSDLMWKIIRGSLYGLLSIAALFGFLKLVRSSSEELLPTGIPVGQLVGGQLVYEAPSSGAGGMMSMPTGMVQGMMPDQAFGEVVAADQDVEELQAAKSKLVMDFGLGQAAPERITIEVLRQLIRENPIKMSQAARVWLARKTSEGE